MIPKGSVKGRRSERTLRPAAMAGFIAGFMAWSLGFVLVLPSPAPAQEAGVLDQVRDTDDTASATIPALASEDRAALDARAEEQLQALLDRMSGLEGIGVEVEAGLARLEGEVASVEARERAEGIARRIEGISFVDNRLTLSADLADQVDPALGRVRSRVGDLVSFLPLFLLAGAVVAGSLLVARGLGSLERPYRIFTANEFFQNLIRQAARAVAVLTGVLMAVEILDVTALVGAVVGTAGIAGLALGFAFKDVVENYLAGILLSLRQPFAPNDLVVVEDRLGKIVRLTSRETILMDLNGNHVRIPNAMVFRNILVNYTRNPRRRMELFLSLSPATDLVEAQELGVRALAGMVGVLGDPGPGSRVEEVGASGVKVAWTAWVDQTEVDFLKVRSEAIRILLEVLAEAGIDMPPPEHRVHLYGAGEPPATEPSPAPAPSPTPSRAQGDVSPDRSLDAQIEDDRRDSEEEDLLSTNPEEG